MKRKAKKDFVGSGGCASFLAISIVSLVVSKGLTVSKCRHVLSPGRVHESSSRLLGQPEKASPDDDHHSSKHGEKSWTHFGYEDVLESEKKQKGKYKS